MRIPADALPEGVFYERDGPVVRVVGTHLGRVRAPRDLGVAGAQLDGLIARQRDFFAARGQGVEWKVRAHDLPAELPERLVAAGFVAGEPAAVLIGPAAEVAGKAARAAGKAGGAAQVNGRAGEVGREPDGVVLRRAVGAQDMRRIAEQQTRVWGFDCSWVADDLTGRVTADPGQITVLVAEAGGQVVSSAWSVYQRGTEFVALLGGTTVPQWRGRGLYSALVAARAREAVERGFRLLHVDASPASAPILRRYGFQEITTSRHYQWVPPA
ncbi:N-acetyltransferase [Paractinoplanes deccanensis]|uniref:N-acetyltransferase n=2 Tax=Paractinoplanes deccanensis TaxID=113561 RepID=A0ABQ3YA54_9ACTN|nr:N-acetyltransferase [Actinoplanes deccanensis]